MLLLVKLVSIWRFIVSYEHISNGALSQLGVGMYTQRCEPIGITSGHARKEENKLEGNLSLKKINHYIALELLLASFKSTYIMTNSLY